MSRAQPFLTWAAECGVRRFADLDLDAVVTHRAKEAERIGKYGRKLRPHSVLDSHKALFTFPRWARARRYEFDPSILEVKRPRVPKPEADVYHMSQLGAILAACNRALNASSYLSDSAFRSAAYCSKIGSKSGSLPAIAGSRNPENTSVILNRVVPSGLGASEYVRTPRNITGLPCRHTISSLGTNRVTLSLKVLPGASGTFILTIPPGSMSPSILVRVEFQRTMSSALVRIVHTLSGGAWISADTVHCIRKVDRVFTVLISVVGIGPRVYPWGSISSGLDEGRNRIPLMCVRATSQSITSQWPSRRGSRPHRNAPRPGSGAVQGTRSHTAASSAKPEMA